MATSTDTTAAVPADTDAPLGDPTVYVTPFQTPAQGAMAPPTTPSRRLSGSVDVALSEMEGLDILPTSNWKSLPLHLLPAAGVGAGLITKKDDIFSAAVLGGGAEMDADVVKIEKN